MKFKNSVKVFSSSAKKTMLFVGKL